jgi:hypothetical protein
MLQLLIPGSRLLFRAANRHHAHAVAILLAKQRHSTAIERSLIIGHLPLDGSIRTHPGVDTPLELTLLFRRHLAIMCEVEA